MKRRDFHLMALMTGLSEMTLVQSQALPAAAPIDAITRIKALRITTGPLTNGYLVAPNGRLNWYFTQLGLIPIVQYLNAADLDTYIRQYMDLYLSRLEGNLTIRDVNFTGTSLTTFTLVSSDSDNSYASTLLSLAARYLKASQNWAWWDAHKARLKDIAYANIALTLKSNGLCRVFHLPNSSPFADYGYLMNNAEDYRALRDFAALLTLRGDSVDANYYNNIATGIAQSIIINLWDSARLGFKTSDQDRRADTTSFYPGTTCQVFPQAFGISELAPYFTPAYNYLNTYAAQWPSEIYDPYPWAILGYVAAKRGDTARARMQMLATENKLAATPALLTINELGFYQRTKSLLNGFADI